MAEFGPVPIIDDNPAQQEKVAFGFETYARTLAEIMRRQREPDPARDRGPRPLGLRQEDPHAGRHRRD